jgi:hypothetical protein
MARTVAPVAATARQCRPTTSATGTRNTICGLTHARPSATPDRAALPDRSSHQWRTTSAITATVSCPSRNAKASGNVASQAVRCATRLVGSPGGAAVHHTHATAAASARSHSARASRYGRAVSGAAIQATTGRFANASGKPRNARAAGTYVWTS